MRYELTKPVHSKNNFNSFLTDRFLSDYFTNEPESSAASYPTVDVLERNDEYLVHADLPGMQQKDIDVGLTNGILTIKGERKHHEENNGKNGYFRSERTRGQFLRSFTISDVDEKNIKAEYANGVLTIHLPKAEEKKERKILIN